MNEKLEIKIQCTHTLSAEDLSDFLVTIFEGGLYWGHGKRGKDAPRPQWAANNLPYYAWLPLTEEGSMIITDIENDDATHTLDKKAIIQGLTLLAQEEPTHFADLINEQYDIITTDLLLQYSLFKEVIYG